MPQRLPRYLAHAQRAADLEKIVRIVDGGAAVPSARGTRIIARRSAEADPLRLRGTPIISRGVGGTMPGSDPVQALLAKERRRRVEHAVEAELRVRCRDCGDHYWLSARRERDYRKAGQEPLCVNCHREERFGPKPSNIIVTQALRDWWLDRYTIEEIRELAASLED